MRILGAFAVILFIGSVASAQLTLLDEGFYLTRQSVNDWVPVTKIEGATDAAPGAGAAYLRFAGDAGTASGAQFFSFTGSEQPHPRITVGQINPTGSYLTFKYRLANPSAGQSINIAMGLSADDWAAQPAGAPAGQANGVFLYGTVALNETDPGGYWGDARIDLPATFAQTLDASTELNRLWIHNIGWNANSETVFDVDQVIFYNGTPAVQNHPGDFNGDKSISDADYTIWANYYNQAVPAGYFDGNGDGIYTDADYTIWANGYGQTFTVPEPATMSLLGLGLFGLLRRRSA